MEHDDDDDDDDDEGNGRTREGTSRGSLLSYCAVDIIDDLYNMLISRGGGGGRCELPEMNEIVYYELCDPGTNIDERVYVEWGKMLFGDLVK